MEFDSKSHEGMFLGYASNNMAYCVYNKEICRVEKSVNMVFDDRRMTMSETSQVEMEELILNPT